MAKKFTQEEDNLIRTLRSEGKTCAQVGAIMGRSESSIQNRATEIRAYSAKAARFTADHDTTIRNMVARGASYDSIGAAVSVSAESARRRARQLGIVHAYSPQAFEEREIQFLKSRYLSLTVPQMAEHLGRSIGTVAHKLRRLGLSKMAERSKVVALVVPKSRKTAESDMVIPMTARPWLTRKRGECGYPYGPKGDIHSCCEPVWNEGVYCQHHAAVCGGYRKVAA